MKLGRTRLAAGVVAAALPLALLAGCGEDEPQPKFDEPTSELPSASPSPSGPVEPTPPAAMKGDDVEAAEAFVKYYFGLLNYAKFSGDIKSVRELALPTCVACHAATDSIQSTHRSGGNYQGGEFTVRDLRMGKLGVASGVHSFRGLVWVDTKREVIRGTGDETVDGVYQASKTKLEFVAVRDTAGWHVGEWKPL